MQRCASPCARRPASHRRTEQPAEIDDPELDRLFERMLREPANLDIMFQYAQKAVENGNYDAAIGTLSRMLLFNPNLPRVRLELGALYFQLGSYEAARTYLTQALAATDMPADVRERASAYLAEIDRRTARSVLTGSLTVGARWHRTPIQGRAGAGARTGTGRDVEQRIPASIGLERVRPRVFPARLQSENHQRRRS